MSLSGNLGVWAVATVMGCAIWLFVRAIYDGLRK